MAFRDCINRAIESGDMDRERAQRILREYDDAFAEFQRSMGETQADIEAARSVTEAARADAAEKRRVMQLAAAASKRQVERLEAYRNIRGDLDPGQYLQDMISNVRGAGGATLSGKFEAVRRSFRREMTDAITAFRANIVGVRRKKALLRKVEREVFGEDTGDAHAKAIAQSWSGVAEKARLRFNSAGGHTGHRADWGLPQKHDTHKVRKAGYEEWRAFIAPRLDLEAMGRDYNNGLPFTDETFEVLMNDAYQAIRTDGYSRRSPSARYGSAMYNRRADHRFFKFKDADAWREYSERFGSGLDTFRVMMGHLDNLAMDVAMMEELGPNPLNTFSFLSDAAKDIGARSSDVSALKRVKRKTAFADQMFDTFTGKINVPGSEGLARGGAAIRNYLSSAHLGSAVISSITDFNYQRVQSQLAGFGQIDSVKMLGRLASSKKLRSEANDAGLIFENAVDVGNAAARYDLEDVHVETAARLADATIRASGLGALTEMQKQAHGLVIMNGVAKQLHGKSWADIGEASRRFWKSYGIGEREWGVISKTPIHTTADGLALIRAQEIEEAGFQDVADLYMEAISSSSIRAVPQQDIRSRASVAGIAKAGTPGGETLRFMLQFKSFPIKVMIDLVSEIVQRASEGRKLSALSYAANILVANTLLGAVAVQMKEGSKGRDPRDMTTQKFWNAAFLQGGGAGIFGDFFFSDVNRFGGGFAETLAGPGAGLADDLLRFTMGNAREVVAGEDTHIGREFVGLLRRYTPGGSLWYLRLAYEREVLDQVQQAIDPEAARSFRRRVQSASKFDTQYFAPPGVSVMGGRARLPDFGNAIGE